MEIHVRGEHKLSEAKSYRRWEGGNLISKARRAWPLTGVGDISIDTGRQICRFV